MVLELPTSQTQLLCDLHLIHEVANPQAFGMLQGRDLEVAYPSQTRATVNHVVPTSDQSRPFHDDATEEMMAELEQSIREADINFSDSTSGKQGIVHVIGPEKGLTQSGMTIVCGGSHTPTHGAFGALASGIRMSQIRDVLVTQTVATEKKKARKIEATDEFGPGVEAKDVILEIIRRLGTEGGAGYVCECTGETTEDLDMEDRMSTCNMSTEGGVRAGYINPNETTYEWPKGAEYFQGNSERFGELKPYWEPIRSDKDAEYNDVVTIDGFGPESVVMWGTTPGQSVGITQPTPAPEDLSEGEQETVRMAQEHMGVAPGETMEGYEIDVAFLGSCTNTRLLNLRRAVGVVKGRQIADNVRAMVVPGSQHVKAAAGAEGLDEVFGRAGSERRETGYSMCPGMNEGQLEGDEASTSSLNRNFIDRQGPKGSHTVLMSLHMVAAAAVTGEMTDVRELRETATV